MVNPKEKICSATDVLIVGGGPAGLAAAIALKQRGIDCIVVEALSPTIDKACGEGLMPDALDALTALGVEISDKDGYRLRGIRFANSGQQVNATFPNGAGIGVRRTQLHSRLASHAESAGASIRWKSHLRLLDRNRALINGEEIRFQWLIGADGHASFVRRWAGLDNVRKERLRYGFRRHYQVAPWSDNVEVHWGQTGQLYVTPVAHDCVCVVFVTNDPKSGRDEMLACFPEIARRLEGASLISQMRGAVSATLKLRAVIDENIALIGDASGSTDAITGEGLAMSFRQAHALATAIAAGSLEAYGGAHERIGKLSHQMGSLLLTLDRWPALGARVVRVLSSKPYLFHELLSVHMGVSSLSGFAVRRGPELGWNLLTCYSRT